MKLLEKNAARFMTCVLLAAEMSALVKVKGMSEFGYFA